MQSCKQTKYSWTSDKWPPKISSLGSHLLELRPLLSQMFCLWLEYGDCRDLPSVPMWKVNFKTKCDTSHWEKSLLLPRNMIVLQNLFIQFLLHCLSRGCLWEVKNKKVVTFKRWSQLSVQYMFNCMWLRCAVKPSMLSWMLQCRWYHHHGDKNKCHPSSSCSYHSNSARQEFIRTPET